MKVVREYINEKFTQDSDAIADMGIGVEKLIRDFMRNDIDEYQDDDDAETTDKDVILGYCAVYGKEDFMDYLISKGANINSYPVAKWFSWMCRWDNPEEIKAMISRGYNFHGSPGPNAEKGLRVAMSNGHLKVVKVLIDAGADPEVLNGKPIKNAINSNRIKILEYLKEKGFDLGKWDYFKTANDAKNRAVTDFIGQEIKAKKKKKIRKFFGLKESLYEGS